jgi:hypothetical protein
MVLSLAEEREYVRITWLLVPLLLTSYGVKLLEPVPEPELPELPFPDIVAVV